LTSETRKTREAQTNPKISFSVIPRKEMISLLDVEIENIGMGPATNIQLKIRDVNNPISKLLVEMGFFKYGINYLAPGKKVDSFLTSMNEDFGHKKDAQINVEITYENANKKIFKDTFLVDMSLYENILQLGRPPLNEIAKNTSSIKKSIDKIQRSINTIQGGYGKIKVVVEDNKEKNSQSVVENQKQSKSLKE
jgi:hypothetical protein